MNGEIPVEEIRRRIHEGRRIAKFEYEAKMESLAHLEGMLGKSNDNDPAPTPLAHRRQKPLRRETAIAKLRDVVANMTGPFTRTDLYHGLLPDRCSEPTMEIAVRMLIEEGLIERLDSGRNREHTFQITAKGRSVTRQPERDADE